MRIRAQVLRDLRPAPDGFKYSVSGQDTVAKRAGQNGPQTVTVVNNTCMTDSYQYNFAAMYAFIWQHERCHLMQYRNVFGTIPDPRTKLETIVRSDTAAFHDEAFFEPGGYQEAGQCCDLGGEHDRRPEFDPVQVLEPQRREQRVVPSNPNI
jgi:hypothetical protein